MELLKQLVHSPARGAGYRALEAVAPLLREGADEFTVSSDAVAALPAAEQRALLATLHGLRDEARTEVRRPGYAEALADAEREYASATGGARARATRRVRQCQGQLHGAIERRSRALQSEVQGARVRALEWEVVMARCALYMKRGQYERAVALRPPRQ